MRLRVRYHRLEDLVRDHDEQLSRGGLLVRVEPPQGLKQFDTVELEISAPRGTVVLDAQVVQLFAGVGVAVTFEPSPVLLAAVKNARVVASEEGPPPVHEIVEANRRGSTRTIRAPPLFPDSQSVPAIPAAAVVKPGQAAPDKMKLAIHGNRDERAAIMRDTNPSLHVYVLRNPGIQVDEVLAFAKLRTVGPEVLKAIADRREWAQRADVAIALVRNPKTPVPIAVRLLDHVGITELRVIAKDDNARAPIQQAARKKVLG
ncbi:MAG: hypothetical protein ABI175_09365 [Polyangiales bacterium]